MEILIVDEYMLIEKKDKSGIAISLKEIPEFNFEQCSCLLKGDMLVFEPEMYSSNYIVEMPLTKGGHFDSLKLYDQVTVAQIKQDSSFGDIFEIDLAKEQ